MKKSILVCCMVIAPFLAFSPETMAMSVEDAIEVVECESGGRYDAVGDGGKSHGIVQFQKATFNWMKKAAGHPNWSYKNPVHQLRLMVWAVDHGYGRQWTCYRHLQKKKVYVMLKEPPKTFYLEESIRYRPEDYSMVKQTKRW